MRLKLTSHEKIILVLIFCLGLLPSFASAQSATSSQATSTGQATTTQATSSQATATNTTPDLLFKAKVIKVLEQKITTTSDGARTTQQRLLLRGLEGKYKGKDVEFNGIGTIDVINKHIYHVGDTVLVDASSDNNGNVTFYVTDFVRTNGLLMLFIAFCLVLLFVGRFKGIRSVFALSLSFLVIVKYIIPGILNGVSPLLVTVIGSFFILVIIIYITEGWKTISHLSLATIFISLLLAIFISMFFVSLTKLTGVFSEQVSFLVNIGTHQIDFQGLLLAGIIIGTLGVLDDVVISQIATVGEIAKTDPYLSRRELFRRSYRVGISHIASMTNTLFLAYAGVSLPLLILFASGHSAFSSWGQVINNEAIATEIVRTLSGSIGLVLSVPIATVVAVWKFGRK